jgi:hypothetical protein
MKIQTNAGEVELTAEMVVRGMVFEGRRFETTSGRFTCGRKDKWGAWQDAYTSSVTCPEDTACRFLGCDPTIATRADCERFGIAPGIDAGAHGFARLRGGGAVDLRRVPMPVAAVARAENGDERIVLTMTPEAERRLGPDERFVGMHARRIARPEDVERLCCGATARCADYPNTKDRCTLAIGHDDQHEDLATGVRWPAKPSALRGSITTSDGVRHTVDIDARGGVTTASETDEALRARLRVADMSERFARHVAGEPEPGTPAWIEALVAQGGFTCEVKRAARGPGTVDVMVHGASQLDCAVLRRRLVDAMPGHVDVLVEPSPEKADSRAVAGVRARRDGEAGADARTAWGTQQVATGNALDMLAGEREMRRGHGETDMALRGRIHPEIAGKELGQRGPVSQAERPRVVVHQGMVTLSGLDGYVMLDGGKVRVWTYRDGEVHEVPPSEYDVVRLDDTRPATAEDAAYGAVALLAWCCRLWDERPKTPGEVVPCEGCNGYRLEGASCRVCAAERYRREAPLVALVNACPEGLDPRGWQAAVLAAAEVVLRGEWHPDEALAFGKHVEAAIRSDGCLLAFEDAHAAYHRALQPTTRPVPFRRRAPGLPCDDGRDW